MENQLENVVDRLTTIVAKIARMDPDRINRYDNLIELGADSVILTEVNSYIRKEFRVDIPITQFFEQLTTIADISEHILPQLDPDYFEPQELPLKLEHPISTAADVPHNIHPVGVVHAAKAEAVQTAVDMNVHVPALMMQMPDATLSSLFAGQLEIMNNQLRLLSGNQVAATTMAPTPAVQAQSVHHTAARHSTDPSTPERNVTPDKKPAEKKDGYKPYVAHKSLDLSVRANSEKQQEHIQELMKRYTAKTQSSKQFAAKYRMPYADCRNIFGFRRDIKEMVYQLVFKDSQGSRITDIDGNSYIDLTMDFGATLFGHNADFIKEAIAKEFDKGFPLSLITDLSGEVAEMICEFTGVERVSFFNSGTEAVMVAMRLARAATGKNKVVMFAGSYHGTFDGVLGMHAMNKEGKDVVKPIAVGVPQSMVDDIYILDYDDPASITFIKEHADELAAVLVEPVQSRRPDLQPRAFLHELRQVTADAGITLIFDEMILGFRLGAGGAQELFGVQADLVTFGKVVGGGMPIGIVAGKQSVMNCLDGGVWNYGDDSYPPDEERRTFAGGTFCHHPLAMAAAKAVLLKIKQEKDTIYPALNARTKHLADTLNAFFKENQVPVEILYCGSLLRFALRGNMEMFYYHLLDKGVYIWEGRNCFLSASHTDEDIEQVIKVVKETCLQMKSVFFLTDKTLNSHDIKTSNPLALNTDQQKMLAAEYINQGSKFFLPVLMQVEGELDYGLLNKALAMITARHEALRYRVNEQLTEFRIESDPLHRVNVIRTTQDTEADSILELVNQAFDLMQGPLFKIYILESDHAGSRSVKMLINAHHLIADGWSMSLLIEELVEAYNSLMTGGMPRFSEVMSFREYRELNEQTLQTLDKEKMSEFWRSYLYGCAPALQLPHKKLMGVADQAIGERLTYKADETFITKARKLAAAAKCSTFTVLLSAYQIMLHFLSDQDEFAVGVPVSGQQTVSPKALIGSCNTIMPLVSQISAETNMSRLVKQNTKAFSEFEKFHYFNMDALELEAAIQQPLLNVMFNMDREPQSKEFIHTAIALIPLDVQDAKYDLFFNLMEFKGELVFDIDFNSSLFTRETVARWLQLYLDIVEQLSKDPNRPLHSLHLFREEDARVTLSAGNHTDLASLEKNLSIRAADFGIVGSEFSCSIWSGEGKPVITSQFGELYLGRNQYESFNTGWVARITLDAKLELAGPQDRFFVRDGQRCSLWLIEQMLRDCPLLAEAQVTYDDIHRRIEADVAFVQSEPSLNHLMDWCHSSLPKEMIPDQFYTADKDAGRTLLVYERQLMTAVEETLFEMVSGLLGSSQFRKEDNLFVLGMNSLKVLNLVSQIEGHYGGIRIPLARLVMSLSVEGIAGIVGEMNQSEQVSPSRAISPIADQPYYETSSAQKRMYIVHQLQPESINYNLPFIVKVTGSLDIEKFNRALSLIVSRHENLRANFDQIEGEIVQFIKAAGAVQLEMLGEREAANDEAWLSGIQKEFIRPFDLQKDSLMRAGAAKLGDNEWILLFDFHHIIFDGASGLVFAQELMAAYNGLALLPLKCQYKDFVYWHNELLHSEEIKTQEAYWQNRFNDELPVSSIPTDFPRPLSRSYAGNIVTHQLDGNIKQMITEFCKEHACTPYAFFISILKVLVSRYSMQPEVIVGTLVEGRNHTDLQSLIGMFVNTLPIRSTVEPERPFSEFVRAVQHLAMNAFSNSDLPFERISQLAGVKSEGSRNPVFDILFSYQNFGSITMEAEDVNFEFQELLTDDCKFDINFEIFELEDGYSVAVEYSTELYMQDTIASLIQHFEVMLHSALADPKLSCGAIEILTTAEKNRLLLDFNHTAVEIPKDKLIIDLFEEQVAKCPGKKAVICGDEITTYIELDAIANKAAHQLLCRGISQGDIVAVSLERSTNLIAAILGILKCGAAFLPLADDYPEDRKQFVAADSEAKLIITERVSESFTVNGCQQITVDELLEGENTTRPILHKDSFKQLCYCIYTSGSTGTPKGVKITNGNLLNYLVYCRKEFVNGDPVMPLFSNIAFDLTMTSLFLPLCSGGQIHVYSKGMETDLHDIVSNPDLNVIKLTPSHLKLITSAFHDLSVMTNVQSLIVGGEELESRTAEETLRKLGRHIAIHNEYGPTETTIGCCDYVYQTDMDQARRTVLIGKPIDNTQTYVLQGNQLCGVGMIGELCIGGLGVGKGYLNRPELTQAKFIDSPFKEGEVLYRTGDLAKWQPDGNLEYLGRIDEQIKIRGHRIEPGDIEEAIRQHIGVKDAAVIVREDQTGDKLLCAYVVKEDTDTQVTIGQLKHDIRKYLPAYMVPAVFTFIEQLPVTSNGKLDRRALPAPTLLDRDDCILPRNEQEECLVHIFKEVLALEQISIDDNFFEMGGHSLRAVRLINLIEEKTGTRLSLKTIFDRPTVIGLSEVLNNGVENRYEKIPQAEKKRSYPMSSQQKRLYIIQEFDETQTAYNVPGAIEIKGKLEPERIKAIFEQLSQRHESLRTSFHMIAGELEQHIHDAIELDFCVTETDQLEKLDASDVLKEFIRPFDLGKAPLFRIQLLQDGADRSLFLFDMHHLISDGMTINIIMKEFSRIYNGEQLQPLEIQYKDYSEWMRQKDIQAQETYWLQQFSDQIPVLDLPLDYPRPQIQQFSGSNIDSKLDNEIFAGLQKLCKHTAVTEYMVLLSAFMVLFSKYSRQEDIIIGTPVSGRVHQDTEHVLGMFVNTLAMRGRPAGDKAFVELLDEVKDMCIKGFENQEYPFENLVEKLDVKRDMSRNPIFDVLFVFQNTEEEQFTAEGLEFGEIITESGIAKFDLTITVNTTPEGYAVNWEYGNHLFNEATIQRMAVHYEHILQAVMLQPTTKIRDIEMISWPEKQQILSDFNNTFTPYDLERNVFRLFEQWAEETPEKTAVKYGDREVSYRELNQKANQLAQYLLSLNLKDENIAGIMLERTPEMIQSMLGIWKAGGAYLPLDVSHPLQRRLDILNEANVQYVVTLSSYATPELLHQYEGNVICLDLIEDQLQALEHDNIEKAIEPFSLAYILFTSGSTGKPKGVMIEHAGMLNHILAERDMLGLDEHLVFAQNANHCFDISVWQMVGALALGGTTVIYSNEMVLEPRAFVESVVKDHVTLLEVVPSYLSVMMDCLEEDKLSLPNLKHLMITGEAVKPHLLTRWSTLGFEVPIVNAYGPAEASDDISQYVISGIVPDHMTSVPIGQPLHNIRIYILDPYGNLCPVGVTGELCVAGVAVGRGYVNDKLRTDQVFTADPFQQWLAPQWAPFQRMYRTGDLARWLPDGTIDYWGRMDEQVKVRGYRIELGEIEAVLRRQPEIKDVAVITRQESSGEQYICAYLVPKELGRGLNVEQIKSEIRKYLPEYMIPSYLMALDELPVTSNGKLDRKALPEPSDWGHRVIIAPRNPLEDMLTGVFKEVLGLEEVSIDDSFFELGGHSLKAAKVVNLIESITGIRLPLRTLFERPTVAAIGELLSEQGPRSFEPIPAAAIKRDYPMSSAQKRLYVIHQMDDLGTVYNMPGVLKLEGKLDPARIQAAFQELVRRHESLRTSFHMIEGELLQRIEEHAEMAFTCEELDHGEAVDAAGLLDAFTTPFDLAQAPLLRAKIVKIDADQSLLLVDMHHIISDAATIQIIMKEFTQLYNGETLPPLTVQYKDYSEWLRSRDLREQESYWLKQFDDEIPVLDLPLDYPRPQTQQFSGGSFTLNLKDTVRAQVQRLSQETGATEYMVLLASFMVLLHKYTRQEDVIVGTPISGRTHPDTEAMVGMFVNTLALRGRPTGEKTYTSFLSEVREVCLQAYSHQEYPLEDLVERVQVKRDMSRNPLFDVVFVLQNEEEVSASADGLTIQEEEMLLAVAKFDLAVTVEQKSAGYAVNWTYCDELFKEESVRRMAVHFERILEEALGAPQQRISEMEVVTEQEQAQILQMFNEDNAEYDTEITVAELFAEQVRRVPERIAAVCEGEELTYAELDQRAGRIAAQLRQRITTEAMVGVRLERDLNLVTAILGVVQAGGVYLPIDPDAPAERTSYILADSGVQVLLTSRTMLMAAPFSGEVLYVEDLLAEEDAAESQPAIQLQPEQGLYVIYTSGTTGNPKGTMIEHRNVVRLMKNSAFPFEITEEDVWTLFHGTSFDFSVWEMYGALLYGGKLVIVPKGTAQDSYALRELLLREQVTVLNQVPSSFYELMQADANEAAGKLALRYLIFGGEALNPRKLKAWRERNPEVEIVNMYGITETTVHVTYKTVTEQDIEAGISNIGRAIPTTSVYILNGTRLCGIGMPGELCVGGAGVARGYHERPELTAAKFVDNPYVPGERMYRSGDLARWLPDGSMEYLGRMDEQVKIRGYRIELGEIEQVLIQQAGIRDAAVIIRKDAAADPYICAYVMKTTEAEGLEPAEIKKALQRQLPDYMIPSHIIEVEKLPVTVNGKLDRRKLPEPVLSSGSEYTAPRNAEEATLAEIFEQILGMERIGIDDSFFELGGDSIKAIRVISRLREAGYGLSVKDLMKERSIRFIAGKLETDLEGRSSYSQEEVTGGVRLTPIQQQFFNWNLASPHHYNQAVMLDAVRRLNSSNLQDALTALCGHHDMLRAVYAEDGQQNILSSQESPSVELQVLDLSDKPSEQACAAMEAACNGMQAAMDLAAGPLLKAALFQTKDKDHLFLCAHHLIVDGVSWRILVEDLVTAYQQIANGEAVSLPLKTASFQQWAEALNEYAASAEIERELNYWKKISQETEQGRLQGATETGNIGTETAAVELDEQLTGQLLYQSGAAYHTEINDLLLTALARGVQLWTGQSQVAVDLEGHGREAIHKKIEIDRTVGWFTSIYPVNLTCTSEDLGDNIGTIKEMLRKVPNHGVGYGVIQCFSNTLPVREPADLCFNYLGEFVNEVKEATLLDISELSTGESTGNDNAPLNAITLNSSIVKKQLVLEVTYDAAKYSAAQIQQFTACYVSALTEIVKHCAAKESGSFTASDFGDLDLEMDEFNEIMNNYK